MIYPDGGQPKDLIRYLLEHAALTSREVGRLLGVPTGCVVLWARGYAMHGAHLDRLARVCYVVSRLPGRSARARRKAMWAYAADDTSVWTRLVSEQRNQREVDR